MAASVIEQQPPFTILPVGQPIIFSISNTQIVSTQSKVKFIAEVHVSFVSPPNLSSTTHLIGIFKTTPNNAGVGMFDFSPIVQNYVNSDVYPRESKQVIADATANNPTYYETEYNPTTYNFPIQFIDKFSLNTSTILLLKIRFKTEYLGAAVGSPNLVEVDNTTYVDTGTFKVWNGFVDRDSDMFVESTGDFGFYWQNKFQVSSTGQVFLTNAPTTQSCNLKDFMTLSFLTQNSGSATNASYIRFTVNGNDGSTTQFSVNRTDANGAFTNWSLKSYFLLLHVGVGPANLNGWSSTFQTLVTNGKVKGGSIDIQLYNPNDETASPLYKLNINCVEPKGYETISLCWLNQWGGWDYFTFTKKSIKTINTTRTNYNQLQGTWDKTQYNINDVRGGTRAFKNNAIQRIQINTDFVNSDHNLMFEILQNSPEVYIMKDSDVGTTYLNSMLQAVRLTNSSFTTKTIANNKLIQYTFEIELSRKLNTQLI